MARATRLFLPVLLLAMLAGVVGIVLLFIKPARLVGLLLLMFAVPMFFAVTPGVLLADAVRAADSPRLAWSGVVALVGLGLCLPVAGIGLYGALDRGTAGYAFRYGDAVTAHVPDSCTQYFTRRTGETSGGIDCDNATWTDRGKLVTGTLSVTDADLGTTHTSTYTIKDLPAWAYRSNAWTKGAGTGDFTEPLGKLPGWLIYLFVPAGLALVPWILLARRSNAALPASR